MMANTLNSDDTAKPDILTDIVAHVLALGATRFHVNQSYDRENVWAIKGPVEFRVASFRLDSANGSELRNTLQKGQTTIIVNGAEYLLDIEISDSADEREFRVTIKPSTP
jgi:hypothetical protein